VILLTFTDILLIFDQQKYLKFMLGCCVDELMSWWVVGFVLKCSDWELFYNLLLIAPRVVFIPKLIKWKLLLQGHWVEVLCSFVIGALSH